MEILDLILVDDEPIILEGMRKTFDWEDMGFSIIGTACDAESALKLILEKKPHVVITDICMKQMSGLDLIQDAQSAGADCVFIALSAHKNFEYAQRACELGAAAYLLKPLKEDALRSILGKVYNTCMLRLHSGDARSSWKYDYMESQILSAVRRNDKANLKSAMIEWVTGLSEKEGVQTLTMQRIMLRIEVLVEETYGMSPELQARFREYRENMSEYSESRLIGESYKLLEELIDQRVLSLKQDEYKGGVEYLADAVDYIEKNMKNPELSVVEVAASVYLNPVYFGRVFKRVHGVSFRQYLLQRRMEKAKEMLENGRMGIGAIAEEVGIVSPSYFTQLFKQYTGKLPSEYRKDYSI